jgi:hypothetical protein
MKARVATMLSLTGVLVAGSAAALVNTQVLRSAAPASNTVQVLGADSPSTSPTTVEPSTEPSDTTIVVTAPSAPTPDAELHAYQAQNSGIVTLDTAGDVLRIDSVVPAEGWEVMTVRQVDSLNVLVAFHRGSAVVEFRANLLFDTITPSVSTYLETTGSDTSTPTSTSTGGSNTTTPGTTRTTVDDSDDDDSSHSPTTSDDSGKGRGGGGDDPSDD